MTEMEVKCSRCGKPVPQKYKHKNITIHFECAVEWAKKLDVEIQSFQSEVFPDYPPWKVAEALGMVSVPGQDFDLDKLERHWRDFDAHCQEGE